MRYLYLSRSLDKRLKVLRRADRKGENAAEKCSQLLDILRTEGATIPEVFCKRTKHGECRIGNCVKYDLGHGYRLVTVLKGDRLFIPFVGSHDEANAWLDNHRDKDFCEKATGYNCEVIPGPGDSIISNREEHLELDPHEPDIYEESLRAQLDESILKSIFRGLYCNLNDKCDSPRRSMGKQS